MQITSLYLIFFEYQTLYHLLLEPGSRSATFCSILLLAPMDRILSGEQSLRIPYLGRDEKLVEN